MFLIRCPHCAEAREEEEFHAAGEAHLARPEDPDACTDAEWGEYLYFRQNPRGAHRELWLHAAGCGKYFHVARDTRSYEIFGTYRVGEDFEMPAGADTPEGASGISDRVGNAPGSPS